MPPDRREQNPETGRRTAGDMAAPEAFAERDREDAPPNINQEVDGRKDAAGGRPAFPDNATGGDPEGQEACRYLARRLEELDEQQQRLIKESGSGHMAGGLSDVKARRQRLQQLYQELCTGEAPEWEELRQDIQSEMEDLFDVLANLLGHPENR